MNTTQVLEKRISFCKNNFEIKKFLQELIKEGLVKAYNIEIDKSIIEKDTERKKVIKIIKGASLNPITYIHPHNSSGSYFFQNIDNPKIFYAAEMNMRISDSDFEDLEYTNGNLNVKRLSEKAELKDISEIFNRFDIPKDIITGTLDYSWSDLIKNKEHHERGHLRIEGVREVGYDKFFSRLEKFLSQEN